MLCSVSRIISEVRTRKEERKVEREEKRRENLKINTEEKIEEAKGVEKLNSRLSDAKRLTRRKQLN